MLAILKPLCCASFTFVCFLIFTGKNTIKLIDFCRITVAGEENWYNCLNEIFSSIGKCNFPLGSYFVKRPKSGTELIFYIQNMIYFLHNCTEWNGNNTNQCPIHDANKTSTTEFLLHTGHQLEDLVFE